MTQPSDDFVDVVTGAGRMWMPTRIRTDWAGDGYDGDRTIDDLGRQAGEWSVSHHLDDGLPDEVSFVAGLGTAGLGAELGGAPEASGPGWSARAYFSPLRTDSPIHGYARDVAPVTLDAGLVTDGGPEYVRVFTGQMADIPLRGKQAALNAISAARLKLSALVHPPAVAGRYEGARADWVISYALAASGIYLSPPPQPGCRYWAPMHGSVHPFIPSGNHETIHSIYYVNEASGTDTQEFRTGPYHLGADFAYRDVASGGNKLFSRNTNATNGMPFGDGDDMLSQAGARAKIEMWIYGYEYDMNDFPSASASVGTEWFLLRQTNTDGTFADLAIGAGGIHDRKPYIFMGYGGGGTVFLRYSTPVPKDGAWHKLGLAYDFTTSGVGKVWINLDGVVESSVNSVISLSGFPATEDYAVDRPYIKSLWPLSEVQITAGAYANPDVHPWLFDIPFTPGAKMTPSLINLVNVAETQPREAWELIGSYAQAELAMLRTDENDIVTYLGPAHWVKAAQQVVQGSYDTAKNIVPPVVTQDPTKIRNATRVTYNLAQSSTQYTAVGSYSSEAPIPPGDTTFVLPLSTACVELRGLTVPVNDGTGTQPIATHYVTLNTSASGTGLYLTAAQAVVTVVSWHPGAATIRINNNTSAYAYLMNDNNWPALQLGGKPHLVQSTFVEDYDIASILERGERSLAVSSAGVQREVDARRLARNLKANLSRPVIVIGDGSSGIEASGDPRRRPGHLVTVRDDETGIDDSLWRLQTVEHTGKGATYRNVVTVRRTLPILVIGQGRIGRTIIGPNSRTVEPELGL